jgi:hypothetical protein
MAKKADTAPTIPKTEAVRKALEAGRDKPREGVVWIKETFHLDVTPEYFSTTKSAIKAAGTVKVPSGPKGKEGGPVVDLVELARDLEGLQRLKAKYGAEAVKQFLDEGEIPF